MSELQLHYKKNNNQNLSDGFIHETPDKCKKHTAGHWAERHCLISSGASSITEDSCIVWEPLETSALYHSFSFPLLPAHFELMGKVKKKILPPLSANLF